MNSVRFTSSVARQRDVLDEPLYRQPRNSRCACGSGKKFKKCCIGKTLREVFDAEGEVSGHGDSGTDRLVRL